MRWRTLGFLVVAAALAAARTSAADAVFTAADGRTVRLSDYQGKQPVVLLFMRGFTGEFACYYCGVQTREYAARYAELKQAGAEVLVVLPGAADAAGYLRKVGAADEAHPDPGFTVPFPVVSDPDFAACRTFHVPARAARGGGFPVNQPATIVIGKDGSILYEHHGKDPSDRAPVDAVLAALRGVAAPPPAPGAAPESEPSRPTLDWVTYEAGMKAARERHRPVLLEFYADW